MKNLVELLNKKLQERLDATAEDLEEAKTLEYKGKYEEEDIDF